MAATAAGQVVTVALSGRTVPGLSTNFVHFAHDPQIDRDGLICFSGNWSANEHALFVGTPGQMSMARRFGPGAPTLPGGVSPDSLQSFVYTHGRVAARVGLAGPGVSGSNDSAVLTGDAADPALAARSGTAAAGAAAPFVFLDTRPVLSSAGHYALLGDLSLTRDSRAIVRGGPGQPATAVMQTGDAAPGAPAGSTVTGSIRLPVMSDAGDLAFFAAYEPTSGPVVPGIYHAPAGGAPQLLASAGAPTPTTPGLPAQTSFSNELDSAISMGRQGHVAFAGRAEVGAQDVPALWMTDADGSNLRGVVSALAPIPGAPAASMIALEKPAVSPSGAVAFVARYQTGGSITAGTDERLFKHDHGATTLWLTEGEQVPGQPAGVRLQFSQGAVPMSDITPRGDVAILPLLFGPGVTTANNRALLGLTAEGELIPVVRLGDLFEVAPGDLRTVTSIGFAAAHNTPGAWHGEAGIGGGAHALADDGTLVFALRFSDFSSGVFAVTIPAPGPVALAALCTAVVLRRRRRQSI